MSHELHPIGNHEDIRSDNLLDRFGRYRVLRTREVCPDIHSCLHIAGPLRQIHGDIRT